MSMKSLRMCPTEVMLNSIKNRVITEDFKIGSYSFGAKRDIESSVGKLSREEIFYSSESAAYGGDTPVLLRLTKFK